MGVTNRLTGRLTAVHPDVQPVHPGRPGHLAGHLTHQVKQPPPFILRQLLHPRNMPDRHHQSVAFSGGKRVREGGHKPSFVQVHQSTERTLGARSVGALPLRGFSTHTPDCIGHRWIAVNTNAALIRKLEHRNRDAEAFVELVDQAVFLPVSFAASAQGDQEMVRPEVADRVLEGDQGVVGPD